jgi:transcriptional regulator with XRE-family HTH domain
MRTGTPGNLRELQQARGINDEAAGFLAGVDPSTVNRIANGIQRPLPVTVVALARVFGTSIKRMQALCDASWAAAHGSEDQECLPTVQ